MESRPGLGMYESTVVGASTSTAHGSGGARLMAMRGERRPAHAFVRQLDGDPEPEAEAERDRPPRQER